MTDLSAPRRHRFMARLRLGCGCALFHIEVTITAPGMPDQTPRAFGAACPAHVRACSDGCGQPHMPQEQLLPLCAVAMDLHPATPVLGVLCGLPAVWSRTP